MVNKRIVLICLTGLTLCSSFNSRANALDGIIIGAAVVGSLIGAGLCCLGTAAIIHASKPSQNAEMKQSKAEVKDDKKTQKAHQKKLRNNSKNKNLPTENVVPVTVL
jgi:ketopantoate reductase